MKTFATSAVLCLSLFFASFARGQAVAPTLGRNNNWTGMNNFLAGKLSYGTINQQCTTGQYQAGFRASDFSPICLSFTTGTGVTSINGLQNTVAITNTDTNISVHLSGQNIVIDCPGCGGSGGSPGGSPGAIQQNIAGSFAGTIVTGIVVGQGAGQPVRAGIGDTDFALPFVINCTGSVTCPLVGGTYTFSVSGSAGTGAVASANFGQQGGYATQGTTIGGTPNVYSLNPSWSLSQMNALFSRFNYSTITAWSVSGSNATFQAVNSYSPGDRPQINGLTVGSCFNGSFDTVLSTGLSNTQFEINAASCTGSATESGIATLNVPSVGAVSNGVVIVPPGLTDNPSSQYLNQGGAQVADFRKGYWMQQASAYGVKCDDQHLTVTLTSGSNLVNVGSAFATATQPIGMTMVVGQQVGYAETGLQNTWSPIVTGYPFPNLQLSSNSPISGTFSVIFGTNNQASLQRAINDLGGAIPLWLPQCTMLTDTVRYSGTSLLGQQMQFTNLDGFPAHDILQQQDGLPLIAWSINASTGVTTFTVPSYAAHSILAASDYYIPAGQTSLPGDKVNLQAFPSATFFNGQTVNVATHPTPTTFTVNSAFGQSTSSGTDQGLAAPTTNVSTNELRQTHLTYNVNMEVDPSYTWNQYDQNATLTVEPPLYRPIQEFDQPANNPFGQGWGSGTVNGVATITQNTGVICAPTAGRIPVVGTDIVFPYQTGGMQTFTVASTAGSCGGGFTARTLGSYLGGPTTFPNTSGYTASQAEWFTYTAPQTLAAALPGTISLPYAITVAIPFPPNSAGSFNVSSHGHIIIGTGGNSQEWDYMGVTFGGTAGGTATFTLRNGPTSLNGGAGYAIGSVVFPLNPCQAMYHNPYPVVPTINGGQATPVRSTYYAGNCGGNSAIALPSADAIAWAPFNSSGFSLSHFEDVQFNGFGANGSGNQNANGSMGIYQEGNYTGYGSTWDDLRFVNLWAGFAQGPSAVNEHGVRGVGPTSTGQSIHNCTARTGYGFALVEMQQSNMDRCDTYSTEVSQYDGQVIGASLGLMLGSTFSELDGNGVDSMFQFTVKDYNNEPENGTHEEIMPSVVSNGNNITWIGDIFEGGYNIFGGSFQRLFGTQMAVPVFNYGVNNYFENLYGVNIGYNDLNVYNGTSSFYNWGTFSTCSAQTGVTGPQRGCGPGFMQSYNGHDIWSMINGDPNNPTYNALGGLIPPDELSSGSLSLSFDSTEHYFGKYALCIDIATGCQQTNFDGIGAGMYIGAFQRIPAAKVLIRMNVKANSGTFTFRLLATAQNVGSLSTCTPNFSLAQATVTATSTWNVVTLPVDYTSFASCSLGLVEDSGSTSAGLEIGAVAVVPFPAFMVGPLATPTSGMSCPVPGQFSFDSTHMWVCAPSSGITFGPGTWKSTPIT